MVNPGGETILGIEPMECQVGLDEDLLGEFQGPVVVSRHPENIVEDSIVMPVKQQIKGFPGIIGDATTNQDLIGDAVPFPG